MSASPPPPPPPPPANPTSPPPADPAAPADPDTALPIGLSASVVLTSLPRDGALALQKALNPPARKISVRFRALTSAPALTKDTYKVNSSQPFWSVVKFLRDALQLGPADGLHTYINSSFAPALDENVGNLWKCFKVDEVLIVNYSLQSAFG